MTDETTMEEGESIYRFYSQKSQNEMCSWSALKPLEKEWWASVQDAVRERLYVCAFIREAGRKVMGEPVPADDPECEIKLAIHGGIHGALTALAEMIERMDHIPDSTKEGE